MTQSIIAKGGIRDLPRCGWPGSDPEYVAYHDTEWGVPVHDDQKLFEMLTLEGAQAGLSWSTILKKREGYRTVFHQFDPEKVSMMTGAECEALRKDSRIVRNRLKIESTVSNARSFLAVQEEFGSFAAYLWGWTGGKPILNALDSMKDIPAQTELSQKISNDLKRRGFRFVGPTIVYAFMQATGLVNDHISGCFLFKPGP